MSGQDGTVNFSLHDNCDEETLDIWCKLLVRDCASIVRAVADWDDDHRIAHPELV